MGGGDDLQHSAGDNLAEVLGVAPNMNGGNLGSCWLREPESRTRAELGSRSPMRRVVFCLQRFDDDIQLAITRSHLVELAFDLSLISPGFRKL